MEFLAARLQERVPALHRDLLERFEAIGGDAGTDHVAALHAGAPERRERLRGVRLDPFGRAEARLETRERARVVPAELGRDEARAFEALAAVRIARIDAFPGNPVEAHDEAI